MAVAGLAGLVIETFMRVTHHFSSEYFPPLGHTSMLCISLIIIDSHFSVGVKINSPSKPEKEADASFAPMAASATEEPSVDIEVDYQCRDIYRRVKDTPRNGHASNG